VVARGPRAGSLVPGKLQSAALRIELVHPDEIGPLFYLAAEAALRPLETTCFVCTVYNMKAIQVSFDEALLEELDRTEEVRRDGRSAVLRRAVVEYLRQKRQHSIAERYAQAYGTGPGLGKEFDGWEDQGRWPQE
jgi:hypothetical protein